MVKKPLIDAAILRFEGQLTVFRPGHGCYRCLFPSPPPPGTVPDCAEAGVFGAVAGVLGSMQAVEALKVLLNLGQRPASTLLLYDAISSSWQSMPFHRDPECVVCGDHPVVIAPIDYENFCGVAIPADREVVPVQGTEEYSVDVNQANHLMADVHLTILDVRSHEEFVTGHVPGAVHCALEDLDQFTSTAGHRIDAPLLVVCASGIRSAYAANYLRSRGYTAWTMIGGVQAWRSAGRQVAT